MTIKKRFAEKYGKHKIPPTSYTLAKIKNLHPVVYSADCIMKAANPRGGEDTRCDDFVLCGGASVTGIYIVERKGGAKTRSIRQLCAGATFMSQLITRSDRFDFLPVLVADNMTPSCYRMLRAEKVKLGNGQPKNIRHVKSGSPLPPIPPAKGK